MGFRELKGHSWEQVQLPPIRFHDFGRPARIPRWSRSGWGTVCQNTSAEMVQVTPSLTTYTFPFLSVRHTADPAPARRCSVSTAGCL